MVQSANEGARIFDSAMKSPPELSPTLLKAKRPQPLSPKASTVSHKRQVRVICHFCNLLDFPNFFRPSQKHSPSDGDETLVTEGQACLGCSATATPEWRRGPMGMFPIDHSHHACRADGSVLLTGPRTLCNACGLVYAKLVRTLSPMLPVSMP